MKTKEELEEMTRDELVDFVMGVQNSNDFWTKRSLNLEDKLNAMKTSLHALLTLVGNN